MPTIKQLEEQGQALLSDMKNLIDRDPRPWSAKRLEFDRLEADFKAVSTQRNSLKALDGRPHDLSDLGDRAGTFLGVSMSSALLKNVTASGEHLPIGTPQLDLGDQDLRELYDAALAHKSLAVTSKATDSTSVPQAGITQYNRTPVPMRREPTRVLSLIPSVSTAAPSVTWYSTTGTTAAAAVAEGGTKPTSTISYTANQGTVTKIAHVSEVTDETLQDFVGFLQVLQGDMTAGLIKAENDELLNATVTGAHKFAGLLNTSGILTRATSTDSNLDAISKAFDDLRVGSSFVEPDGIVMHPSTWGSTRRSKDGQQRYYLSPDPTQDTDLHLWGVPVVLTTQIAAGTALIGNFRESTVAYVREGIRVETSNQGTTQFTNNTTLVRCEERLLLTVPRPSGLIKVTGLA